MDRKRIYCFITIFIIILGSITPILLYLLFPGKVITLDFEYDSDCLGGLDTPVYEGFDIDFTLDGSGYGTYFTNADGQLIFAIRESGEFTYAYSWNGVYSGQIEMDESSSNTIFIELDCLELTTIVVWEDDLSPLANMNIDLLRYNGSSWVVMASPMTDGSGQIVLDGLYDGDWMFAGQNDTFSIDRYISESGLPTEVYITPIGVIVSIILEIIIIIGVIIYKKLKNKITHKYGDTSEFEILFLNPFLFFLNIR